MYFIKIEEVLNHQYPIFAHKNGDEKETLEEHIKRCEYYFEKIYTEKEIEKVIRRFADMIFGVDAKKEYDFLKEMFLAIVVFHDFGKCNPKFQIEKMGNETVPQTGGNDWGTEHSFLSSLIYIDYFSSKLEKMGFAKDTKRIFNLFIIEYAYVISRHHSNLGNFTEYCRKLTESTTERMITDMTNEKLPNYQGLQYLTTNIFRKTIRMIRIEANKLEREQCLFKYFYYRMVYSVLVASDYHGTTEYMNGFRSEDVGKDLSIEDFKKTYNDSDIMKSIRAYEKSKYQEEKSHLEKATDINELRSEMFLDAERELKKNTDKSIFFLEAPTGSGKSNTALNLSFQLMEHGKKLMYIYPFNTLVEQNREILEKHFQDPELSKQIAVVNSVTPFKEMKDDMDQEETEKYYQKILLDRQFLNYPIILSTHVSFFSLLFGNKKEDIFGFFQLSQAVIVLDEIQSYKNSIWAEIVIFLNACAKLMGMKVIIMSATLPNLQMFMDDVYNMPKLILKPEVYYQHFIFKDRVTISFELLKREMTLEKLLQHLKENNDGKSKILVEFIKKDTAYEFYRLLLEEELDGISIKCLTGDDSLYEREKILKPIKETDDPVILVATQVVEAGIDIDMDIGYKDISILDAEEQFLGRINRSYRKKGKVYFFDLDNADFIYRNDYRKDIDFTLKSQEMQQILLNKAFADYYKKIIEVIRESINDSPGRDGLGKFFKDKVQRLKYKEVEERMKLIEDDNWSMSIVLCRTLTFDDGTRLDGKETWDEYKNLLNNSTMDYAKKRVKLQEVRGKLSYFVYRIKKNYDLPFSDILGEMRCIEDAEKYFEHGKINREKLEEESLLFLD